MNFDTGIKQRITEQLASAMSGYGLMRDAGKL